MRCLLSISGLARGLGSRGLGFGVEDIGFRVAGVYIGVVYTEERKREWKRL